MFLSKYGLKYDKHSMIYLEVLNGT
jgi:hypothetical protein